MIINRKLGTDKLTKNGGVINGSVTINGQLAVNQVADFNDGAKSNVFNFKPYQDGETLPSHNPGNLYFNSEDGTATLDVLNNVKIQLGEELVIYGKALTGEFIPKGSVVMFAGAQGGTPLFTKADMLSPYWQQPRYIVGIATSDIDGNANDDNNTYAKYGYVTWYGRIPDINTGTFDEGEVLYWDPTQSGGLLTNVEPSAPNPKVVMAAVLKQSSSGSTNGVLLIRPDFGYRLNQLHDVDIVSPQSGETLLYSGSKWYNGPAASGGASVTVSDTPPLDNESGDLWWDTTDARLKIYYDDGDSEQWVDASPVGGGSGGEILEELDPIFTASPAYSITTQEITNWNEAYNWGDHSGDIQSFGDTINEFINLQNAVNNDIFTSIETFNIKVEEVYGWGNHSLAGYQPAGDYAVLVDGKINASTLPAIAITDTFVVEDEDEMLELEAETGDIAVRTDIDTTFILKGSDPTLIGNWQELLTPTAAGAGVTSVDMTVPTGFSINGSPITSTGTLQLGFASGYSLPTNASQFNWNAAYSHSTVFGNPHNTSFAQLSDKPTTVSGYGITDAAKITVSDTAPLMPLPGNLWWDSTIGKLKVYYFDGDSSQWVDATPIGSGQISFFSIVDKPTTISGYGITDAYTKVEVDNIVGDINTILDNINGEVI